MNAALGSINVPPQQLIAALFQPSTTDTGIVDLIWQIRLPRMLSAAVVGAALGVSGYLLQTLSRNYLADPYLTGVSSGSGLAVAIGIILQAPFSAMPALALAGGLLASLIVAFIARTSTGISISRLLLSGIALSAVCGSLITLVLSNLAGAGRVQGLVLWLAGGVAGRGWPELTSASLYIALGLACALVMSKALRLLSLGSQTAASMGLNVGVAQWGILLTAVVLCGASVSLSGIVGFVGLIAPYIARSLFGRDERVHLITSAAIGAVLVLISDLAARSLVPGQELPLGTLLSLIGAPFFLWLVVKHKDEAI